LGIRVWRKFLSITPVEYDKFGIQSSIAGIILETVCRCWFSWLCLKYPCRTLKTTVYFSVWGVTNAFLISHALQTHSKNPNIKKTSFICICNADVQGSALVKRQTKAAFGNHTD